MKQIKLLISSFVLASILTSNAAVILSTDFSGASVNGSDADQADDITWVENGLTASTSLSLENVVANQGDGHLFAGTGTYHVANGYFGGNTNISRSPSDGQWGTTVTVTVGALDVILDNIVINLAHTGNGGTNSNLSTNAKTDIAITITNTSGPTAVDSVSLTNLVPNSATGQDFTFNMTTPQTLSAGGVYDVSFLVDSSVTQGHYAVFSGLEFNGSVVIPEPSSAVLIGLSGLAFISRRRR